MSLFVLANPELLKAANQEKECLKNIMPLEKQLLAVTEDGGVWAEFEGRPGLRKESATALKVDSKLEQLLNSLHYLCKAINGIPFSDLATYINGFLENKTEKEVRAEFNKHGKTKSEVDLWFKYTYFFNEHHNRKLDPASIQNTIELSKNYFDRYVTYTNKLKRMTSEASLQEANNLIVDVDSFLESDPNHSKAAFENAQVPYWDIDENYGGS
ncbi:MAG: hypothetical protein G3M70_16025 [Candidatus Nitronauta litoralis]|uniref:Uncharacterized protein n=1 Tax=Candidatus Nitronauta litoralis TaxID=2705533 RepID=A0A7T0BYM1_9BACT|nr:MAG: hypothetical protein G3M70_16025 [Candidatus Nitronauta litoralis]